MLTASIFEGDGHGRSSQIGPQDADGSHRLSRAAHISQLMLLAIGAYFLACPALWAQTSDSQTGDADKSWTATTESQRDNVNPTRTTESHTQTGNRTLDSQSVQRRGPDGHFEPYQDIEKETVKVDATTVRTITRAYWPGTFLYGLATAAAFVSVPAALTIVTGLALFYILPRSGAHAGS